MYKSILCLLLFLLSSSAVYACTCATPFGKSDKELVDSAKAEADIVFVGRVKKIVKDRTTLGGYKAVFEASEILKGRERKQIRIAFSLQCCLCDFVFSKGKEYLVYASGESTSLSASICGRTREINDPRVKIDLQYLGGSETSALKN